MTPAYQSARAAQANLRRNGSCPTRLPYIDGSAETWPSGRRRSPAKGVGPEGSRGFESLRLRHHTFYLSLNGSLWSTRPVCGAGSCALSKVTAKPKHHKAMYWQGVPAVYVALKTRNAMAAKALLFTCLTGSRTSGVLGMPLEELDFEARVSICPEERMQTRLVHRVPPTDEMLAIVEPLKAIGSESISIARGGKGSAEAHAPPKNGGP